jgi:hypothetical protein
VRYGADRTDDQGYQHSGLQTLPVTSPATINTLPSVG